MELIKFGKDFRMEDALLLRFPGHMVLFVWPKIDRDETALRYGEFVGDGDPAVGPGVAQVAICICLSLNFARVETVARGCLRAIYLNASSYT